MTGETIVLREPASDAVPAGWEPPVFELKDGEQLIWRRSHRTGMVRVGLRRGNIMVEFDASIYLLRDPASVHVLREDFETAIFLKERERR